MRSLYQRVLADAHDEAAWRELAAGFARAGNAGRAVACLEALDAVSARSNGSKQTPPDEPALRREAARAAVERRRELLFALTAPDDRRVHVTVLGEPGTPETVRTLASLCSQTLEPGGLRVDVVQDRCAGLKLATGRYVAHLEAGDELWPDHLATLADHLDRTGRDMTFSRALRPGRVRPGATEAGPVLPRQAARSEFAPSACVLHRRRALQQVGGFEPHLGRGQAWHLWRRFVDRLRADAVPVLSARVGGDDVSPERRFDLLLVKLGGQAGALRKHRKARAHLARGDADLAAQTLARAWNLGLPVDPFVSAIAAVAEHSRQAAADLVGLGGAEVEPHVRGAFRRIARGAEARRSLAIRTHRHALRLRYREAEIRGVERARSFGYPG